MKCAINSLVFFVHVDNFGVSFIKNVKSIDFGSFFKYLSVFFILAKMCLKMNKVKFKRREKNEKKNSEIFMKMMKKSIKWKVKISKNQKILKWNILKVLSI